MNIYGLVNSESKRKKFSFIIDILYLLVYLYVGICFIIELLISFSR